MSGSNTRQVLALVVAVAVIGSVAGAPVAAAAIDTDSDSELTELSSGSQTAGTSAGSDTTDDDDGDETDDGEDANETDDGTDDEDGSATDETDETDESNESSDDSSGDDPTLRGDSTDDSGSENGSDDTSDGTTTERVSETVDETVEKTTETAVNRTEDVPDPTVFALDVDGDTVTNTTEEVVENVQLESALGLGVLELVEPLETGAATVDRTHTYDETATTDHEEPPTATETETAADGNSADDDEVAATAAAVGTSGEGQPDPADPAGAGAAMGLGALATVAALRGSPILTGSKAAGSSGWVSNLVDRVRPFVFPLRYSRYDDSDPLEHEARERVYEIVNDTPGSYLSEVSQEAGLPLSTTRHHIKVLEREDLVTGAKLHGKRRFFPAYAEGIELAAALNDDSTASIIDAIARIGAAPVSDLADELDRDPSTISHHLQRLEEDGVITRERDGRAVVSKLSAEARTALEPEATPETGEAGEIAAGSAD